MKCIADGLLICIAKERLDEQTLNRLEDKLDLQKIPTWSEFKAEVERIGNQLCCSIGADQSRPSYSKVAALAAAPAREKTSKEGESKCSFCSQKGHFIYKCEPFLTKNVAARLEFIKRTQHCYNCLQKGHGIQACRNTGRCRECKGRHHTLLHEPRDSKPATASPASQPKSTEPEASPSRPK